MLWKYAALRTFLIPENWLTDKNLLFQCLYKLTLPNWVKPFFFIIRAYRAWNMIRNITIRVNNTRVYYSCIRIIIGEPQIISCRQIQELSLLQCFENILNWGKTSWGWAVPSLGQALTCQAVILSLINKNSLVLVRLFLMYLCLKVWLWRLGSVGLVW